MSNQPNYLAHNTPLEDHRAEFGLWVKREDLCCPLPGPPFSKTRGVFSHMERKMKEGFTTFGVLDTYHSQGGQAVAYAAYVLGARCINYFPIYKAETRYQDWSSFDPLQHALADEAGYVELRPQQQAAAAMEATMVSIPAGRSAVLYHAAKRDCVARGGYMFPNALKLPETLEETAAEFVRTWQGATDEQKSDLVYSPLIISCSSATIASGVIAGLHDIQQLSIQKVILHMGYTRSPNAVYTYIDNRLVESGRPPLGDNLGNFRLVDEGYSYKDVAKAGPTPPWACNDHYDLKAFRWWMRGGRQEYGTALSWNIG